MTANNGFSSDKAELNRRDFLTSAAALGGAMIVGFHLPPTSAHGALIEGQPWYRRGDAGLIRSPQQGSVGRLVSGPDIHGPRWHCRAPCRHEPGRRTGGARPT
jgi:hypothetical protein